MSRDMRWRSWLRHCTTSWKVTGSIPDGVTGIFHWHNPSGHTMALRLTQPLTEMSTRNISWGVTWSVRRADNLTNFMCLLSKNIRTSASWNPLGLSMPVQGTLYLASRKWRISEQSDKITSLSDLPSYIFLLNNPNLLNFSSNILQQFHCI